ncbi:MAG: hemolysin family protein [Actinomycetota bacterium]|nr:hemolysin family protein [Actinomycetota bacterium]
MSVAIGIIALVILIAIAAFLAEAETSLMRVNRIRVRYLSEKNDGKAQKLERLVENPDQFLPPLLLAALFVQLISASLATWVATDISGNAGIGVAVGTVVVTIFMFIFGELVPKAIASHDSEKTALRVTGAVSLLTKVLRPLAILFGWIAKGILRIVMGGEELKKEGLISDEGEIKALVSAAKESEVIEEEERDMIQSIFEFGDRVAREVMVPRPDVFALSEEATVEDALAEAIKEGFSRIPVYGENLDDIKGILYLKDLIRYLQEGRRDEKVGTVAREAYIIPETKKLSELLHELQSRKVHMAIVVDEYGIVVGLVTIEDLIEEIVGEIFDEYDLEVTLVEKIQDGVFRVDARMNLDELNEILGIDMPEEEDVDTVGGLVLKVLGHMPVPGETFVYNGASFKVEKLRNNRISKVVIELIPRKSEENA